MPAPAESWFSMQTKAAKKSRVGGTQTLDNVNSNNEPKENNARQQNEAKPELVRRFLNPSLSEFSIRRARERKPSEPRSESASKKRLCAQVITLSSTAAQFCA